MPIEIRELVIRTAVVQEGGGGESQGGGTSGNGVSPNEEMIRLCLDKVNEIIKDKNER